MHQKTKKIVFQNASYDVGWITADLDLRVRPDFHDTMAMAYMLDEQRLAGGWRHAWTYQQEQTA
jgi:hypothetical protein